MTPEQMTAHVVEVCDRNRITIWWISGYRARAVAECLEIFIPKIRSAVTYAMALHELGHCLGRYQTSRSVLVTERWAWRWAKRNARIWTPGYGARPGQIAGVVRGAQVATEDRAWPAGLFVRVSGAAEST